MQSAPSDLADFIWAQAQDRAWEASRDFEGGCSPHDGILTIDLEGRIGTTVANGVKPFYIGLEFWYESFCDGGQCKPIVTTSVKLWITPPVDDDGCYYDPSCATELCLLRRHEEIDEEHIKYYHKPVLTREWVEKAAEVLEKGVLNTIRYDVDSGKYMRIV
jgi:hypothetical protein